MAISGSLRPQIGALDSQCAPADENFNVLVPKQLYQQEAGSTTQSSTQLPDAMYRHRDNELERIVMVWSCQCSRCERKTIELRSRKCRDKKGGVVTSEDSQGKKAARGEV